MTKQPFTAQDRVTAEAAVRSYTARAPQTWRLGFARPAAASEKGVEVSWPHTVPEDMWDGTPAPDGGVAWKPVFVAPRRFDPYTLNVVAPPLLDALLHHVRMCAPFVATGTFRGFLAATPTHAPNAGMRLLLFRWRKELYFKAGYLPFGFSQDETTLLCCDRRVIHPDGDSPVVLLPHDEVFRMFNRPRRSDLERRAVPVQPSVRAFIQESMAALSPGTPPGDPTARRAEMSGRSLAAHDWEPALIPDSGPTTPAPPQETADAEVASIFPHFPRIEGKLAALRLADPAFLVPHTEYHRYRMNPLLDLSGLESFEGQEQVRLPEVYRQLLLHLGNGGFGPGRGIARLEYSSGEQIEPFLGPLPVPPARSPCPARSALPAAPGVVATVPTVANVRRGGRRRRKAWLRGVP
jgi:hypothetical protein